MGGLLFKFKPIYFGLMNGLTNLYCYIIIFSLINLSVCIYEDQIGKFDWKQTYVGKIKAAQFDTVSTARKIIVATEENVLAALNLKTGQVVWRHVLETASRGNIQLLHVSDKVVTVSGDNPYLVRSWDPNTGVLLWEWAMTLQNAELAMHSRWWVQNGLLVHILPVYGAHLEVTTYNLMTGNNKGGTSKLPAVWNNEKCVLSAPFYTCISGSPGSHIVLSMDLTSDVVHFISKPLSNFVNWSAKEGLLRPLDGSSSVPGFLLDDRVIIIQNDQYEMLDWRLSTVHSSAAIIDGVHKPLVVEVSIKNNNAELLARDLRSGNEVITATKLGAELAAMEPYITAAMCTRTPKEANACRILLTGADDSMQLIQQEGRVLWTREEALANIVTVEFIDLPVSELDAEIEAEFDHKVNVWSSFVRRIRTQAHQLATLAQTLASNLDASAEQDGAGALVRDYFDLHKMLFVVTRAGKIFGMDNLSGDIVWRRFSSQWDCAHAAVYSRRSARHPPHLPLVSVVAKNKKTGNGIVINVNPLTGENTAGGEYQLDYMPIQSALLYKADAEHLRALLLLDADHNVEVLPVSAAPLVDNMYMFVAHKDTTKVEGFALRYDGTKVEAVPTWSIYLGGGPGSGHTIVKMAAKSPQERVHSQGKVMGDRSVLYKYINPNLVLFLVEGPDPVHKDVVTAWLVDVVSGGTAAAQTHRRARVSQPGAHAHAHSHALHADNFIAYSYYNEKHRRTEIATLELYEGSTRSLPAGAAFSSLGDARAPLVERQAYILPGTLAAAAVTITEKGITDKHVLLALSSGGIVELPWLFLDPRRPVTLTQEHREEGLVQYAPELPLPAEAVLNYNRTLHRVAGIHTAPSGLESTCLVLATGLDLFYTRVAPSKTFDLLKDDFDYYLITIVLAGLIAATYVTKYFASRKLLRQAWK